jgi:hypothetical protein
LHLRQGHCLEQTTQLLSFWLGVVWVVIVGIMGLDRYRLVQGRQTALRQSLQSWARLSLTILSQM